MLNEVAYYQVMGLPLIVYGGIATFLAMALAAAVPILNKRGIRTIPMSWHQKLGMAAVLLGLVHGVVGVLAYL